MCFVGCLLSVVIVCCVWPCVVVLVMCIVCALFCAGCCLFLFVVVRCVDVRPVSFAAAAVRRLLLVVCC